MSKETIATIFQGVAYVSLFSVGVCAARGHIFWGLALIVVGHFAFHAAVYFYNPYNH